MGGPPKSYRSGIAEVMLEDPEPPNIEKLHHIAFDYSAITAGQRGFCGFRFRSWFRVWGLEFTVQGLGFRVYSSGLSLGSLALGIRSLGSPCKGPRELYSNEQVGLEVTMNLQVI